MADELLRRPELLIFGEDVGRKGGVYNVTNGLQKRFGQARVFDTILDETSILGIAQGAAHIGLLPVPEIQYLAYIHNALDQIRGEAATLQFFSSGQFRNPMVVRVAGLAYQKGFGGHFHNDNSIGALRDIPGVVIASPARGDDAARMFRGAVAMAIEDGRVVVFLEPIALYHEKDLHADGDGGWLTDYPAPPEALLPGAVGLYGATEEEADVLLVSYANGLRLSLQAAKRLAELHDLRARVLDLRWLNPLPTDAIRSHATDVGTVVVVDECRATGAGVADAIIADLAEQRIGRRLASIRAVDSFVPLGPATSAVLVGVDQIVAASVAAVKRRRRHAAARAIMTRAAVAFPARGSYGPASLRSLPPAHPWVRRADQLRREYDLPALSDLDGAAGFDPGVHLRSANASPLTFLSGLLDAERIAGDHEVVVVVASSTGWYTALAASGALEFDDAFRLVQTMALAG